MKKIENNLLNAGLLEKYIKNNKSVLNQELLEKIEIIEEWKNRLKNPDDDNNFTHEKSMYPYFQEKFLKSFLGYNFLEDWVFEKSKFTLKGVVEFAIKDSNNEPIILIELKGQKADLDKPQRNYGNKTPVQQAYEYAINSSANWYIIFNYNELRIYNEFESYLKEKYISFKLSEITEKEIITLLLLLSKEFFKEKRIIDDIKKETLIIEKKITDKIYSLYHETRLMLISEIQELNGFEICDAIKYAQLIMNRIMFICFAEDRGLLPHQIFEETISIPIKRKIIKRNRSSIWQELNNLFIDINEGHTSRNISEYNGGIFEEDLSFLKIQDLFEDLGKFRDLYQNHNVTNDSVQKIVISYQNAVDGFLNPIFYNLLLLASFDFNTEVDVNIMGHIFEQSLTDLEELQTGLDLETKKKKIHEFRKKEGIFYTPEYVTDYICRNTIIPYLSKKNSNTPEALLDEYNDNELDVLENKLKNLKILDLACGSGAFLNKAVNVLLEIHKLLFLRKQETKDFITEIKGKKQTTIEQYIIDKYFDSIKIRKNIILNNIYGVDINSESVGITQLSLFLEVAIKNEKLPDLHKNIKCGNSLIDNEDGKIEKNLANKLNTFNWNEEFGEILKNGGFDIIIGNPPYVRQEKIGHLKPFFETKYEIFNSIADLYCYFFEKGLNLLKTNGILGYISSNKWMRTRYGYNLRVILKNLEILKFVNFFELKVFKDASVEPCIIILRNKFQQNENIEVVLVEHLNFQNFNQHVKEKCFYFDQTQLDDTGWNFFKGTQTELILNKIKNNSITLRKYVGKAFIKRGLMTGKTSVFVIDEDKYKEIIGKDPKSKEIIKPLINGVDIEKFAYDFTGKYIVLTKIGTNINDYPGIKQYLLAYKEELENRDKGSKGEKWFELRKCAYYNGFEMEKIVYIRTAKEHKFALDTSKGYLISNCFFISIADRYLLAYLNSSLFQFYKINTFVSFGDAKTKGRCKLDHNRMEVVPIKRISNEKYNTIKDIVDEIIQIKKQIFSTRNEYLKFLRADFEIKKISSKLYNFWELLEEEFLKEIKKQKKTLKLKERREILEFFTEIKEEIIPLIEKTQKFEKELNNIIYEIYDFDLDERTYIENFINSS